LYPKRVQKSTNSLKRLQIMVEAAGIEPATAILAKALKTQINQWN
jgi:hypothetical protein